MKGKKFRKWHKGDSPRYATPDGMERKFERYSGSRQGCEEFLRHKKKDGWKRTYLVKVKGMYWEAMVEKFVKTAKKKEPK